MFASHGRLKEFSNLLTPTLRSPPHGEAKATVVATAKKERTLAIILKCVSPVVPLMENVL